MPVEIKTFKLAKELSRSEIFLSLARLPGGGRLLVGAADGKVYDVDLLADKPEFRDLPGHESYVTGLALVGDVLVSGGYDCRLIWRKLDSGEILRTVDAAHARWIRKLAPSPNGKLVASVGDDMICRVWDAASGAKLHELKGHEPRTPNHFPSMLYTCAFSPDSGTLATADRVGRVILWDVSTGAQLRALDAAGLYTWDPKQRIHSIGGARSLAFTPDGEHVAVGGIGRIGNIDHLDGPARVEVFQTKSGEKVHEFSGDGKGLVEQLVFAPGGNWFVGAGGDNGGLVQFYDLQAKKVVRSEKAPMHIHAAALSESADRLFAVGHSRLAMWDVQA